MQLIKTVLSQQQANRGAGERKRERERERERFGIIVIKTKKMLEDEHLNETASEIQLGGRRRVDALLWTHILAALFYHVMRKRYPNSLLGENTLQRKQSDYTSHDVPALHLPMTKSISVTKDKNP